MQVIWTEICKLLDVDQCNIVWEKILFNSIVEQPAHVYNFFVLIAKQFIFRCKCQNKLPTFQAMINEVKYIRRIELYNSISDGTYEKMLKKWKPVFQKLK